MLDLEYCANCMESCRIGDLKQKRFCEMRKAREDAKTGLECIQIWRFWDPLRFSQPFSSVMNYIHLLWNSYV